MIDSSTAAAARSSPAHRAFTWRGVSLSAFALLLLGPLLAALVNLMIVFWLNLQAAHAHVPPRQQLWIATTYAATYAISSLLAGRWGNPRRAMRLLLGATVGVACVATATFLWVGAPFWGLLLLAFCDGTVLGQYFVPFQMRMGDVRPFQTLAWSVAFYNASWSAGDALGPLVNGALGGLSPAWLTGAAWLITALHLGLILIANRTPHGQAQVHMTQSFASTPRQRRWGWVGSFLVFAMYIGVVLTLYPGLGVARGWSDAQISFGLMAMAAPVVLTAPLLPLWRRHMGRPWVLIATLLAASRGLVAMPLTRSWPASLACLAFMGLGIAGVTFHAIYYVNADRQAPSRSIGINEGMVGAGSTLGPLVMGTLAWNDFGSVRPYWVFAALLVAAAVWMAAQDRVRSGGSIESKR